MGTVVCENFSQQHTCHLRHIRWSNRHVVRSVRMISRVILVLVIFFCFSFFLFDGVIRVGVVFRKPDFRRIATINGLEFSAVQQNSSSISLYKTAQRKLKLQSGIVSAISRLNYEFSNSEDSIHANDVNKKLPRVTKLNSMTILGDVPVGEIIPANTTRKVIILTSWRSGSSFLGDLLNHYPGTFYYFEPLHYYSYIKDKSKVQNETDFIKSLLSCEFDENNEGFLEHVRKPSNSFLFKRHNFRLWNSCKQFKPREALCYSQDYLNQLCPLYPIKLVKTVRMRVRQVDTLLRNSSNVKADSRGGTDVETTTSTREGCSSCLAILGRQVLKIFTLQK